MSDWAIVGIVIGAVWLLAIGGGLAVVARGLRLQAQATAKAAQARAALRRERELDR